MLVQAILVGLVGAFGGLDYQLGTLYAFRPIVLCPLVGLVLGDLQTGLAVGASLELLFMGSVSIGAYVPPNETIGGVLACAFAIQLGQGTETAIALAMPIVGEVLTPASWNAVDIKSLMFLTAAMAVGSVGGATGMNAWIADVVLPSSVPENIFLFALLVAALSMIIHMFMGSVMAVLGVCVPAFISFAAGSSVSPLAVALIVFTSINIHYILPFHNLPILIGEGKDAGGYTSKEAMRMGIPLTAVVFVVVLVEAAWFHLFGLM